MKTEIVSMNELNEGKITTQLATKWIKREQHLLINSQTGSGKTTSLMNAALNLANSHSSEFYIFTAPTINLCEQVFKDHPTGTLLLTGKIKKKSELIEQHVNQGKRVFICTYDQVTMLINQLKTLGKTMQFNLIVDEYHRLISDYSENYRKKTMAELFKMQKKAKSLIALSGTPQLILLEHFNCIIEVERQNKKSFQEFAFVPFPKEASLKESLLTYIYNRVNNGYKILVYLQSIKINEQLVSKFQENGISAINIDAFSKKENEAYQSIINNACLPENHDVIMSTSLLSEGVSINIKEDDKIEVIVVVHKDSRFFNPFVIEQISHRIRQPYERLSILTEDPADYETPKVKTNFRIYNYKKAFYGLKGNALKSKYNLINANGFKKITDDIIAQCEKNAYLDVSNNTVIIDELGILYTINCNLERYYQTNRYAFLTALKKQFPLNTLQSEKLDLDTSKKDNCNNDEKIYSTPFNERFKVDDFNLLLKNKKRIDFHTKSLELTLQERKMLKVLLPYAPTYELLVAIIPKSTVTTVNQLVTALNGFVEVCILKHLNKENFTIKYIKLIENTVDDKYYSSKDLKSLLEDAYKFAVTNIDNGVLLANKMQKAYFFKEEHRTNSKRTFTLKLHTRSTLATQFELNETQIQLLIKGAIANNSSTYKKELEYLLLASEIA